MSKKVHAAVGAANALRSIPFWWEGTSLARRDGGSSTELPAKADVVIVGAGLSGLAAARVLAARGRSVVVIDAGRPGGGASSRNGAMLGRYFKHSFGQIMQQSGLDVAKRYFGELDVVYRAAVSRIDDLGVDCGYRRCGRVVGAVTPQHRDQLFHEWELRQRHMGEAVEFFDVGGHPELPTELYVGGVHIVDNAAVHPGRYSMAFLRSALAAGATVVDNNPVLAIDRDNGDFTVSTKAGTIRAGQILVTTNGYTSRSQGWFFRRLSPIDAFMIATEPLAASRLAGLRRLDRTYHDNRKNSNYFQLSEDNRLIFGGRTGLPHASPEAIERELRAEMLRFFPTLDNVGITHAWSGRCAATNDLFPHVGVHDGIHFAIGYCFSGLAMAPYLGEKAAARMLGDVEAARTVFRQDDLTYVPWPKRRQWLVSLAMRYYRMQEPLPR